MDLVQKNPNKTGFYNALDAKIGELFCEVAYLSNWDAAQTFQNYVGLRNLVDRGINSRSVMISVLKLSKAGK